MSRSDLRYAARMLLHSRGFTLVAVATLAVGIGANAAVFSLVNEALLRPLPGIGHPDRLVDIGGTQDGGDFDNMSYPNYADYRDRNRTLAGLAGFVLEARAVSLSEGDSALRLYATMVTGNYFSVLEVKPEVGRFFQAGEDTATATDPVVVLSHRFWQAHFHGDRGIAGRRLRINGRSVMVAGVAPERFQGTTPLAPDLWIPLHQWSLVRSSSGQLEDRRAVFMMALGRLRPGLGIEQVRSDLEAIARDLVREFPEENGRHGVAIVKSGLLPGPMRFAVGGFLAVMMGFVGLVLVLASFNVTGMLLVRASGRRREVAVRVALGASRWRIARQLLTEGVMLFVLGGGAGLLTAVWMRDLLLSFVPDLPVPLHLELRLDWRVIGFGLALSFLAGTLASLVPALQISHADPMIALREETGGTRRTRMRQALVLGQTAVTLILLVCAGLFARSLQRASGIDPGFDLRNLQLVGLDLSLAGMKEPEGLAFSDQLLERVRGLPGIRSASLAWDLPLDGAGSGLGGVRSEKHPDEELTADWNVVTPGYFANMGIPLLRGRDFSRADGSRSTRVAIVNATLARRLWPGEEALGQKLINTEEGEAPRILEVVGVARDQKYRSLGDGPRNFVFAPLTQNYLGAMTLAVRTAPGAPVVPALRALLREMNPNLPILHAQSMEEFAGIGLLPQRLAGGMALGLGLLGMLLAGTGLYSVTAFSTAQRTREIGIRMALGAERRMVLRAVLWQGMRLALAGMAVGIASALAATRWLESLLFGVSPQDPIVLAGVTVALAAVALLACYLPARRAAAVDPMSALRHE
jgi:putative ABC transport system permease protein